MTTNEREIAIREGNKIYAETSYFTPRPQLDFVNARYVFCEGFDRGYIAATTEANKRIKELESEVAELKWKYERLDIEYDQMQDKRIAQISELKASNNHLREAIETALYGHGNDALPKLRKAISATPAESLQAHDDELIEKIINIIKSETDKFNNVDSLLYIIEILDNMKVNHETTKTP